MKSKKGLTLIRNDFYSMLIHFLFKNWHLQHLCYRGFTPESFKSNSFHRRFASRISACLHQLILLFIELKCS